MARGRSVGSGPAAGGAAARRGCWRSAAAGGWSRGRGRGAGAGSSPCVRMAAVTARKTTPLLKSTKAIMISTACAESTGALALSGILMY
jgi:hypothetical protein